MWDLQTLEYLNEQAHQRAIARAQEDAEKLAWKLAREAEDREKDKVKDEAPAVFPLAIIAKRLIVAPPAISVIFDLISNSETVAEFNNLVREYLPEFEAAIKAEPINRRVSRFVSCFSEIYFPLSDEAYSPEVTMGELLMAIPVDFQGFTYNDFHAFADFRTGYILLLSLCESPYEVDDDEDDEDSFGGRVAVLEKVRELVGERLANLIPAEGWDRQYLREKTDGTEFEGCGDFADWIFKCTDYWLLNVTQAEYEQQGMAGEEWSRETVDVFAGEWPDVMEFWATINRLADLLESDSNKFRELLALLTGSKDLIPPKEQLAFPLDDEGQVIEERR